MMKRLSTILITFFLANLIFFIAPVIAQDFNFTQANNDYLYNYNLYRTAHTEYLTAKQQYLTYKTLTAKATAQEKTLKMLQTRDEALRTYLIALKQKLKETDGISLYEKNIIFLRLDSEVSWYQNHRNRLSGAGSLADLIEISNDAQEHYPETEILAYQTLGTVLAGKENALLEKIQTQIDQLEEKIAQVRQEGLIETSLLERWLLEARNRLTWSKEKQYAAQSLLANLKPREQNKAKVYDDAQSNFVESHQYLKEASSYLLEIIREVGVD
jgi:hypothetical protein